MINATYVAILAMLYTMIAGLNVVDMENHRYIILFAAFSLIIGMSPLLYVLFMILYWLFSKRLFCCKLVKSIKAIRQGYTPMDSGEIDFVDSTDIRYSAHSDLKAPVS